MNKFLSILLLLLTFSISSSAQLSVEPDTYQTSNGELTIYPINHGSVAFVFNDKTIFVDPFGGAERFSEFGSPDMIFITDIHGDHLNKNTLNALDTESTTFIVPQAVADQMSGIENKEIIIIKNEQTKQVADLTVTGVAMYNLPDDETSRHKKGRGNGYVINFGGMNVYLSGDTEDIPEMRDLEEIDIAFVCMNLPYTMDIYQAASAVIDFAPKNMYPYHHRGQDINKFKTLLADANPDVNVILKNWYPE